jgi:ribulose-phosphate 3-epimerase
MPGLSLQLGVKTEPIEYRYSYDWLFRLMAEEGVQHAQLGSFFEMTLLPDDFFVQLRRQAEGYGVRLSSVFSSHRELGGWMRPEPGWEGVARRSYERFIQVGALLGAETVGSSPGSLMRDQMHFKEEGIRRYIGHMKELLEYAHQLGVPCLTMEPMSCLAEPPTLPEEMHALAGELVAYHQQHPDSTAAVGFCVDVAHGYADQQGIVRCDNMQLLEAALPYTRLIHLKNTDALFNATFGFAPAERQRGIVHVGAVRDLLLGNAAVIPVKELVGYLEISGPKLGRDYADYQLEDLLRQSLRYLRPIFGTTNHR